MMAMLYLGLFQGINGDIARKITHLAFQNGPKAAQLIKMTSPDRERNHDC